MVVIGGVNHTASGNSTHVSVTLDSATPGGLQCVKVLNTAMGYAKGKFYLRIRGMAITSASPSTITLYGSTVVTLQITGASDKGMLQLIMEEWDGEKVKALSLPILSVSDGAVKTIIPGFFASGAKAKIRYTAGLPTKTK